MDAGEPEPTPWWRDHFDDAWYALHRDLFSAERSRHEVSALLELLGLPLGSRVLDVPCGWARHTAPLAEAGLWVAGADLSADLLRRGLAAFRDAGLTPRLARADVAALPFATAAFDAAIDVFTGLGLFDDDEREVAALAELARVTRPSGQLLLETIHRDDIARHFAPRDRWRDADGTRVSVRRRFDALRGVASERWRWRTSDGREGASEHRLRVYTAGEALGLVRAAGWEPIEALGDWDGRPFGHDSPRIIVRARRP